MAKNSQKNDERQQITSESGPFNTSGTRENRDTLERNYSRNSMELDEEEMSLK